MIKLLSLSTFLAFTFSVAAQTTPDQLWHLNSAEKKGAMGIDWDKALDFVKDKKSSRTIVAVIDAGVDIKHPDLESQVWVNVKEVAGNDIDDDKNGYIDDINGWNFIGGQDSSITYDNLEITRLYRELNAKYELKDKGDVEESEEYKLYSTIKPIVLARQIEAKQWFEIYKQVQFGFEFLVDEYGRDITVEEIQNHKAVSKSEVYALNYFTNFNVEGFSFDIAEESLEEQLEHYNYQANYAYNPDFNPRHIVGDDYENADETIYGNNEVYKNEQFSSHGTHVAGIIAANNENDFGAKGICQSCKIMAIRTVPEGDERDKDVANSIRYAVYNGAKVINMSFGKSYAYNPTVVYEAIAYAQKNNVLLVHSAGNSAKNIDIEDNYPNDSNGYYGSSWIEVGASSWQNKPYFVASFSNYGQNNVDVFAPGVDIYSTTPENQYEEYSGTSMAGPVVAGIAGFILSYYPELTAEEVKNIIIESAIPVKKCQTIPGSKKKSKINKLSSSGSVVNVYNAIVLADQKSKL